MIKEYLDRELEKVKDDYKCHVTTFEEAVNLACCIGDALVMTINDGDSIVPNDLGIDIADYVEEFTQKLWEIE